MTTPKRQLPSERILAPVGLALDDMNGWNVYATGQAVREILRYLDECAAAAQLVPASPPGEPAYGHAFPGRLAPEDAFKPGDFVLYNGRIFEVSFWGRREQMWFVKATDDEVGLRAVWLFPGEMKRFDPPPIFEPASPPGEGSLWFSQSDPTAPLDLEGAKLLTEGMRRAAEVRAERDTLKARVEELEASIVASNVSYGVSVNGEHHLACIRQLEGELSSCSEEIRVKADRIAELTVQLEEARAALTHEGLTAREWADRLDDAKRNATGYAKHIEKELADEKAQHEATSRCHSDLVDASRDVVAAFLDGRVSSSGATLSRLRVALSALDRPSKPSPHCDTCGVTAYVYPCEHKEPEPQKKRDMPNCPCPPDGKLVCRVDCPLQMAIAYVCAAKFGQESADEKTKRGLECFVCYYLRGSRMSGQAFTDWTCRVCGAEGTASSTDTPYYCGDCCKKHKLCPSCGGKKNGNG